jgi:hypothetical protein
MTIDTALTDIMVDTITLAAVSAKDAYGKHTWSTAVTVANCRVQTGNHKVVDATGVEAIAVGKVYVPGSPALSLFDKVTLPDGTQPPIITIDRVGDEIGSNHTVIHYGKTKSNV